MLRIGREQCHPVGCCLLRRCKPGGVSVAANPQSLPDTLCCEPISAYVYKIRCTPAMPAAHHQQSQCRLSRRTKREGAATRTRRSAMSMSCPPSTSPQCSIW